MNEEFQIALSLAINESSIAKVKERLKELKKELQTTIEVNVEVAKPKMPKIDPPIIVPVIHTDGIKDYTAQIEFLKEKIEDLQATLSMVDASDSKSDVLWYRMELEKAQNQLLDLINKQNNLGKETEDTAKKASKMSFQKIADSIKQATKNAKVFTMALIGIRSVYFGIRKAMTTYLSQNQELQNKLNACYYALGSLFAPILERIINIFVKLIGYVNVFLRALGFAGINMANFGKKASGSAKSAKEIKKSLSGFDELNNIGGDDSSGGGADVGVDNPFENQDLDLTWVDRITQFGEWCKANIPLIVNVI